MSQPLLLPFLGFGAILVNLPYSGVIGPDMQGRCLRAGIIEWLFKTGIEAFEAMPILLGLSESGPAIDFGSAFASFALFCLGRLPSHIYS